MVRVALFVILLSCLAAESFARNEDVIEDVDKHGLEKLLLEHDFVALYFCKSVDLAKRGNVDGWALRGPRSHCQLANADPPNSERLGR